MRRRDQRGFSLIEVLIAMIILAIGLLGVAAVQTLSLRHAGSAEARTHVNLLTAELAELIRVDSDSVINYAATKTGSCTAGKLADWCANLKRVLPDSEFAVSWTAASRTLEITVWWNEREMYLKDSDGEGLNVTTAHFTHQVRLPE